MLNWQKLKFSGNCWFSIPCFCYVDLLFFLGFQISGVEWKLIQSNMGDIIKHVFFYSKGYWAPLCLGTLLSQIKLFYQNLPCAIYTLIRISVCQSFCLFVVWSQTSFCLSVHTLFCLRLFFSSKNQIVLEPDSHFSGTLVARPAFIQTASWLIKSPIINRPGVAGAVLQTASSLID